MAKKSTRSGTRSRSRSRGAAPGDAVASKGQGAEVILAEEEQLPASEKSSSHFYKAKLVELARSHSKLLHLVGGAAIATESVSPIRTSSGNLSATITEKECTKGRNSSSCLSSSDTMSSFVPLSMIQSQASTLSRLVEDCPEVLHSVPELASWLEANMSPSGSTRPLQGCDSSDCLRVNTSPKEKTGRHTVNTAPPKEVRVGVGVIVKDPRNPQKIFAGKRKGSHGAGLLALPGGHLEIYETWQECAIREVEEEMGIHIQNVCFAHATNDPMPSEGKHYVTIFMTAELKDPLATPINCEPHKCEGWDSYSLELLHKINKGCAGMGLKLFGPLSHLVSEKPELLLDFLES